MREAGSAATAYTVLSICELKRNAVWGGQFAYAGHEAMPPTATLKSLIAKRHEMTCRHRYMAGAYACRSTPTIRRFRSLHRPLGCSLDLAGCCGTRLWGAAPSTARDSPLTPFCGDGGIMICKRAFLHSVKARLQVSSACGKPRRRQLVTVCCRGAPARR